MSEPVGLLWSWWRGDALNRPSASKELNVFTSKDVDELAHVFNYKPDEVEQRFQSGHTVYIAASDEWVACGWSASGQTSFGVPEVPFTVPKDNRYLLDFITLSAWRGKGVYPYLLQSILSHERTEADRFWVIHEASNHASARGIKKAGFSLAAEVCRVEGSLALKAIDVTRTKAGAGVLGLPVLERS